jgi:hypothetical protein
VKEPSETTQSALTDAWWRSPGVVYFLGVGNPRAAIKIGMLARTGTRTLQQAVARRVSQIQSSNHEPVELLGVMQFNEGEYPTRDAERKERELHNQFKHLLRFKQHTRGAEWFNPGADLLAVITKIAELPEELGLPRYVCALDQIAIPR